MSTKTVKLVGILVSFVLCAATFEKPAQALSSCCVWALREASTSCRGQGGLCSFSCYPEPGDYCRVYGSCCGL